MSEPSGTTYQASGVDVAAGDRAVELMKSAVAATHSSNVISGAGGFAGLYDASSLVGLKKPILATSTDGVGTKVAIAQAVDKHDTIGFDLVGMVVDDLVVCGARPLFMTDYIACGKVIPERIASIVSGIAAACEVTQTALVGGETAEHPGLLGPDEYDVAGAATGVVDADRLLGPQRVKDGDVLIAMASSGVHSNGFSLVRRIVADAGWSWDRDVAEFGTTLADTLLTPTRLYATPCLALADDLDDGIHALSHITGGGLAANVARVLPPGFTATLDRSTWTPPPVFTVLSELGSVPQADQELTFNLGVGMVAVVAADHADRALNVLRSSGDMNPWVVGNVSTRTSTADGVVSRTKGIDGGSAVLVGQHPSA